MSDRHLRSITCPDKTRVVREALQGGWQWVGWDGGTHFIIEWPATGERLRSGATPSVASWKQLAKDIERISGVTVWRRGNRKRSRKSNQHGAADPQVEASRRRHAQEWAARIQKRDADRAARIEQAAQDEMTQRALEELQETTEACKHAAASLAQDPNNPSLRRNFDRLRHALAACRQESA